jgi:hypothetical protein
MYKNGFWGLVKQKDWLLKLGGERYGKTKYTDWIFSIWFSREYSFFDLFKYGKASAFRQETSFTTLTSISTIFSNKYPK